MKPKNISYLEYRRRVFNKVLTECLCRIHSNAVLGKNPSDPEDAALANRLCEAFFTDELNLSTSTVDMTKKRLSEAVTFIKDTVDTAECIADDKADCAKEEKMEIPDEQEVELSQEDERVIDQLFDGKSPELQIDKIRDATVQALMAEDKKAEEIRDAVDIAKSQVSSGEDPNALEETVNRLNSRGPTSLMHAIMNNVSANAIKSVNESGGLRSVGDVLAENSDKIRLRASMIYALFETASVFGIINYSDADVKKLATSIYFEK